MTILACTVDGCDLPQLRQGYCSAHLQRVRKYGSPGSARVQRRFYDAEDAFAHHAKPSRSGHVEWTGSRRAGYGYLRVKGRDVYAHRYAWERVNGPVPDGMVVDHRCRRPSCVRLEHLRVVTQKQNTENVDSPMRGVTWDKVNKKWRVKIMHNCQNIHVGRFSDKDQAIEAARLKRLEIFTCNDADRAA